MRQIRSVSIDAFATPPDPTNISAELFKAQVAARIGREPHEILLKRQGERPFKDQLTLEDYGVSNGVQLDLSVTLSTLSYYRTDTASAKSILAIKHCMLDLAEIASCLPACPCICSVPALQ